MAALIQPTSALPSPSLLPKFSSSPPSSSLSLSKPKLLQSTATQFLLPQPPPSPPPQPHLSKSRRRFPSGPFDSPSPPEATGAPTDDCFDLLRFSVRYSGVDLAKALHALVLKLEENISLGNALIVAYLKLGCTSDAYSVFRGLSHPNVVSYTAVVSGLAKADRALEAVAVFFRLMSSGIQPNEYSFVAILTAK